MTTASNAKPSFFPPLNRNILIALGLSGYVGLIAFDFFGQILSPAAGFVELAPVALAEGVLTKIFGGASSGGAWVLHLLTGLLFYPLGYLFIARPIAQRVAPQIQWWVVGIVYGAVIWAWAVGVMAPFAGWPAFIGWTEFTWVALVGHLLFGGVAAGAIRWHLG